MTYGYVYVAQISQGADYNQCLKTFIEAESYDGPSLIIAYAPCINHGIKGGLANAQLVEKNAVSSGYWNLFRFDPRRKEQGLSPLVIDSKKPSTSYRDFLQNEVRYSSLMRKDPEKAEILFTKAEKDALEKYDHLEKLANLYN